MHPSRRDIRKLINGQLDREHSVEIEAHIEECEACRSYREDYRSLLSAIREADQEEIPAEVKTSAERTYSAIMAGRVVELNQFRESTDDSEMLLAAHGKDDELNTYNLSTLYSDSPEVVLRIMRDKSRGDYLQVISDDPSLVSGVILEAPERGLELVTDESGHASTGMISAKECQELKWRIRMPHAVFSLDPLSYDPDKVEYSHVSEMETGRNDRIQVTVEGKTEGKQITIRVLELDGNPDFDAVRVSVSRADSEDLKPTKPNEPVTFLIEDPKQAIVIRLYE